MLDGKALSFILENPKEAFAEAGALDEEYEKDQEAL